MSSESASPVSLEDALDGLMTAAAYAQEQGESELAGELFEIYQQVAAFMGDEDDWDELDGDGVEKAMDDLRKTYLEDR